MKSEVGKEGKERRGGKEKIRGEVQVEVLPQESKEWIGRGERRKIDRGIDIDRIGVAKCILEPKDE